jgi:hypothetical protein
MIVFQLTLYKETASHWLFEMQCIGGKLSKCVVDPYLCILPVLDKLQIKSKCYSV